MTQPDPFDVEIIEAYEAGKLKSVASKAELNRLKAAARTMTIEAKAPLVAGRTTTSKLSCRRTRCKVPADPKDGT